jgi:hypothetical protein
MTDPIPETFTVEQQETVQGFNPKQSGATDEEQLMMTVINYTSTATD